MPAAYQSPDPDKISPATIAGVAVASGIVGLVIICGIILLIFRRRQRYILSDVYLASPAELWVVMRLVAPAGDASKARQARLL